ncbi:MAG: S41 family peptidase [Capnocytophaga sp.]|nr:S41 family peptidase [Capnocytophaga sp.]
MKRFLYFPIFLFVFACSKEDFSEKQNEAKLEKSQAEAEKNDSYYQVKDFIWKKMNSYYLWQENMPNLADNRFESTLLNTNATSKSYVDFLKQYADPKAFFNSLIYNPTSPYGDRFSYITDDYTTLENTFQGVSASTGINLSFAIVGTSRNRVAGIVNYVIPGTDAEQKGIKRGDIFLKVNGEFLTPFNYQNLVYSTASALTLSLYENTSEGLVFSKDVVVAQQEVQQNPIFIHKVIEQGGKKIGYLMYNSFIINYDDELNRVFLEFKNANIDELILDLRYNSGGYVLSATRLASMISGVSSNKVFIKQQTNPKLAKVWTTLTYFTQTVNTGYINTLNFSNLNKKLYVITSNRTASASELIINNLRPYMDVVQIGDTTVGKNLASITIYDSNSGEKKDINTSHKWAIQPIVSRSANANDFGDYQTGLVPNYTLKENVANLGVLGELSDPLLAKTIEVITGETLNTATAKRSFVPKLESQYLDNSDSRSPLYHKMLLDNLETK